MVLAMGCRERTRGAIAIPGERPSGIFTAGVAQRYVNTEGWLPGCVDKTCGIFFRVNRVCGPSEIVVSAGETQLARFQRERLAPGEMERITLPKAILDKAEGDITLSVREKEAN